MTDWRLNGRAIIGRAYPRVLGVMREPSWILFDIFLPLLGIAAYIFYYRAMNAPEMYAGFIVIGGAMTAYWMNVLWSMATQFYWEKEVGNLQLYMLAPMSRMSVLAGMALGGMLMTTIRAVSTVLLGVLLFDVSLTLNQPVELALVFSLTLVALYGMGMMFSSLFLMWGRSAMQMTSLLQEPIYLVSGFYFPVRALGYWVALAASILPITLGLDGMRQLLFGPSSNGFLPVDLEIVILAVLAVVFFFLARYLLDYMENLGKREGRLTLRWQ
jgi:ABC-2 type transport system permease protein